MRINKFLLVISSLCLLTSCGEDSPIKPDTSGSDTSHIVPGTLPDITSDYSSLISGISKYELNLVFEDAKESIVKLTGANISCARGEVVEKDGVEEVVNNSLNIKETLYENSVLVDSYTGSNESDFKAFNQYSDLYGCLINTYYFVNFEKPNIEGRAVYKKTNEAVNSVLKETDEVYNPETYGVYFAITGANQILGFDVSLDNIIMAGKFDNGDVYVRFEGEKFETGKTITDEFGTHKLYEQEYEDFVIKEKQLIKSNSTGEIYYMTDASETTKIRISTYAISCEYETSSHGKFNFSNLPEVNVE